MRTNLALLAGVALLTFRTLRTNLALDTLGAGVTFCSFITFFALRALRTGLSLNALSTLSASVALVTLEVESVCLTIGHCEGYGAVAVSDVSHANTGLTGWCLELNPVGSVVARTSCSFDAVVLSYPHCVDRGIALAWRENVVANVVCLAGLPATAVGKACAGITFVTLVAFRALRTGCTCVALIAFGTFGTLRAFNTLLTLLSLLAGVTFITLVALFALSAFRTLDTLLTLVALITFVTFIALVTLFALSASLTVGGKIGIRHRLKLGQAHIGVLGSAFGVHLNTHPHVATSPVDIAQCLAVGRGSCTNGY